MENIDFATLFQGIGTMMESGWLLASARVFLVLLGLLLGLEGSARTYGYDSDGIGHGSHQLRNIDDAGRYVGQPLPRSDAFGYG